MRRMFLPVALLSFSVFAGAASANDWYPNDHEVWDMSVPPELSPEMRKSSWTIAHWISADKMHSDCKTANEYMDEGIASKTRRSKTYHITDYLNSCKGATQRAKDLVEPRVKKWCHYRHTDARLNEICSEWERNGERYLSKLRQDYDSTIARFQELTNGYYDSMLD